MIGILTEYAVSQLNDDYDDRWRPPDPSKPVDPVPTVRPLFGKRGVGVGVVVGLVVLAAFWLALEGGGHRQNSHRMMSANNLKQIGLAIHNFDDTYGELPNNTYSPDGKPILSWRVHLLPFIEEEMLYKRFNIDEPWDSPNNLPLLDQMPRVYTPPGYSRGSPRGTMTYYRGFSNPGAVFERRPGDIPRKWHALFGPDAIPKPPTIEDHRPKFTLASVTDGLSNTIFVVEAGDPVEWTKPDDLDASLGKPFPKMGGMAWNGKIFQALFGDGSTRAIKRTVPEDTLRALISHSGNETLPLDWNQ
jgi:Protein of unknown function (DUF1559)